ncbi:MAG: SWIM zinc finger family protein [Cyanobacteria bacterium P01_D01_bin.1]
MTYSAPQPTTVQEDAWWVQQWVDLLNSYRFKKRLERGRNYARQGNILSLEFKDSKVFATVQGTANEPYQLSISIERFTDEDWSFVINTLSQKALYSAQLLAGEMPDSIEAVFTSNGLSLFPFTLADVKSKCSCPDPKNPCKHIAAVYYQLGDSFREDPFVLFQLRGRTKEQILLALRQHRQQMAQQLASAQTDLVADGEAAASADESKKSKTRAKSKTKQGSKVSKASSTPPSVVKDEQAVPIDTFWKYDTPIDPSLVVITPAEQTVLEVIGDMPLPTSEAQIVMAHFKTLYQNVAQQAMMTALS